MSAAAPAGTTAYRRWLGFSSSPSPSVGAPTFAEGDHVVRLADHPSGSESGGRVRSEPSPFQGRDLTCPMQTQPVGQLSLR